MHSALASPSLSQRVAVKNVPKPLIGSLLCTTTNHDEAAVTKWSVILAAAVQLMRLSGAKRQTILIGGDVDVLLPP
ncbi:hypothetical protein TSMEX_008219 [Taenia solium]|eukprot:TsM_001008100 transcript=TsM_001008100 gene=TsM_001008100